MRLHYAALGGAIALGAALRFWQLDLKPLWLDEVITALFSLGHSYSDVPQETFFPLALLNQLFALQPGVSDAQIIQTVTVESSHPPLFFCLMYRWLSWLNPGEDWVWALRSLPALFGVGAIAAIYWLNRVAFSANAGLMAAGLMAVSPFAVYLSQEARHYTLPTLLISLALTGLVQMQQDLQQQRMRPWVWIGWVLANLLGLYTHYFMLLALAAQVVALLAWMLAHRRYFSSRQWSAVVLAIATIGLGYAPWVPTLMAHFTRPETDWLVLGTTGLDRLAPLYQAIAGWLVMVIALPVEKQPEVVGIIGSLFMLLFSIWLIRQTWLGIQHQWRQESSSSPPWEKSPQQAAIALLSGFTVCVVLQFLAIVYLLGKDLTLAPRYNFVYYPAVCALLGLGLAALPQAKSRGWQPRQVQIIVLLVGVLSSAIVVNGLAFYKSFNPQRAASLMTADPRPVSVVFSAPTSQEVALGLSFALEMRDRPADDSARAPIQLAFLHTPSTNPAFWQRLARLPQPQPLPQTLWVVGSADTRPRLFPPQAELRVPLRPLPQAATCQLIKQARYRAANYPYQGYWCKARMKIEG